MPNVIFKLVRLLTPNWLPLGNWMFGLGAEGSTGNTDWNGINKFSLKTILYTFFDV